MRLIDADELLQEIDETAIEVSNARSGETIKKAFLQCLAVVRENIIRKPTAYDVAKVAEQLEDYLFDKYCVEGDTKIDEIVKAGGANEQ